MYSGIANSISHSPFFPYLHHDCGLRAMIMIKAASRAYIIAIPQPPITHPKMIVATNATTKPQKPNHFFISFLLS